MCHFVYARRMRLLQAARYRWGAVLHSSYLREISFGCRLAVTAPVAQFPYSAFASQGEGKLLPFALCSSSEEGKPPDIAANDLAEPVTRRVFPCKSPTVWIYPNGRLATPAEIHTGIRAEAETHTVASVP